MFKLRGKDLFYLILYAIPNTLLSFGIIYIINNSLSGDSNFFKDYSGLVFISIIIYTYFLNIVFQKKLNEYSFNILYTNEKRIFDKILQAPLIALEKYGSQRFYTVVEDLRFFSLLPEMVTHTINNILMLILCLVYLFILSVKSALIILVLIFLIIGVYFLVLKSMSKKVAKLREQNESYYKYVSDLIKGFKELKINANRRSNLMKKYLAPNRDVAEKLDFNINYIFLSINIVSQYGLYFVMGVILFLLPEIGFLEREDVVQYIVILLFVASPINNLINMQNIYTRLFVANRRINSFLNDFKNENTPGKVEMEINAPFDSLNFKEVTFTYNMDETETFKLGPVNLKIEKGETVFVVGGNGSGKSTFINLLSGLYQAHTGEIILNDQFEGNFNTKIQSLISVIYTNNHIFSHNYDNYKLVGNKKYQELLQLMKLDTVVSDDSEASARRSFSKGQSKRMSMIFALLEDKPILVLDEWAADQDPHFRKYFYEELVPKLKLEGKTIIAVTHDDAYFEYADRIIKFDYGKIAKDLKTSELEMKSKLW